MTEEAREQGREGGAMSRRTAAWLVWSMLALTVLFDVFGCLLLVLNAHSPSVST